MHSCSPVDVTSVRQSVGEEFDRVSKSGIEIDNGVTNMGDVIGDRSVPRCKLPVACGECMGSNSCVPAAAPLMSMPECRSWPPTHTATLYAASRTVHQNAIPDDPVILIICQMFCCIGVFY
jgi:hypothetical protein